MDCIEHSLASPLIEALNTHREMLWDMLSLPEHLLAPSNTSTAAEVRLKWLMENY
jgi:hypothetical protein